ncbi:autotransporter outer membrane beta-barrel domain-containing protein [Sodalis sp. C49]|uniref:autotransporter outer membrane beta-barrel domain-containing protein n=1 Tax=Sodalis sp. C49 TaxID=3228929 RepID=UPI003965B405
MKKTRKTFIGILTVVGGITQAYSASDSESKVNESDLHGSPPTASTNIKPFSNIIKIKPSKSTFENPNLDSSKIHSFDKRSLEYYSGNDSTYHIVDLYSKKGGTKKVDKKMLTKGRPNDLKTVVFFRGGGEFVIKEGIPENLNIEAIMVDNSTLLLQNSPQIFAKEICASKNATIQGNGIIQSNVINEGTLSVDPETKKPSKFNSIGDFFSKKPLHAEKGITPGQSLPHTTLTIDGDYISRDNGIIVLRVNKKNDNPDNNQLEIRGNAPNKSNIFVKGNILNSNPENIASIKLNGNVSEDAFMFLNTPASSENEAKVRKENNRLVAFIAEKKDGVNKPSSDQIHLQKKIPAADAQDNTANHYRSGPAKPPRTFQHKNNNMTIQPKPTDRTVLPDRIEKPPYPKVQFNIISSTSDLVGSYDHDWTQSNASINDAIDRIYGDLGPVPERDGNNANALVYTLTHIKADLSEGKNFKGLINNTANTVPQDANIAPYSQLGRFDKYLHGEGFEENDYERDYPAHGCGDDDGMDNGSAARFDEQRAASQPLDTNADSTRGDKKEEDFGLAALFNEQSDASRPPVQNAHAVAGGGDEEEDFGLAALFNEQTDASKPLDKNADSAVRGDDEEEDFGLAALFNEQTDVSKPLDKNADSAAGGDDEEEDFGLVALFNEQTDASKPIDKNADSGVRDDDEEEDYGLVLLFTEEMDSPESLDENLDASAPPDDDLVDDGLLALFNSNQDNQGVDAGNGLLARSSLQPAAGIYAANMATANTLFATRMHDRVGATEFPSAFNGADGAGQSSFWLRIAGGQTGARMRDGALSASTNTQKVQLGGEIVSGSRDGIDGLHFGVMLGAGKSRSHSHAINGKGAQGGLEGYGAGIYGTWYRNDGNHEGPYLDGSLNYNWFGNHVKNGSSANKSADTATYRSAGFVGTVEAGHSWRLFSAAAFDTYLQPQIQVAWMGVGARDQKDPNGERITMLGHDNIQTRLGARLYMRGYASMDEGRQRMFQPYVETNWIHNTHDFGVCLGKDAYSQEGARDIGEIKMGNEGQINEHLALWGSIGQQVGGKGYHDTTGTLGVKVNF